MKLLFLSICGKLNEPEETRYINLYLASLAKFVVPNFENVKVILLTTYAIENKENSLLQKRIDDFGLGNVVELKTIYDMELPEKSLEYIQKIDWYNRIGLHMNLLYDYAKMYNFFDADWIFHADTDSEFLQNFKTCMESINTLKNMHESIIISLIGDSYPANITNKDTIYLFDEPKRINFYNEDEELLKAYTEVIVVQEKIRSDDHRLTYKNAVFSPAQMKVRNDFVGISREATKLLNLNWVFCHYNYNFKDNGPIQNFWPDKALKIQDDGTEIEVPMPEIRLNYHMGGLIDYKLHTNEIPITRIELPGYSHMMLHHSSGWFSNHFINRSIESLNTKFNDTKHIWESDYMSKEEVEFKIRKLQEELRLLQKIRDLI